MIVGAMLLLGLAVTPVAAETEASSSGLTWKHEKTDPLDLAVSGKLEGWGPDETRYLSYATLRGLPEVTTVEDPLLLGETVHTLTVLPFMALWDRLPRAEGANCVLVDCDDGWVSPLTHTIILLYEPYLILEVDGHPPAAFPIDDWWRDHFHPYFINISPTAFPSYHENPYASAYNPAGSIGLRVVNYRAHHAPYWESPYANLPAGSLAHRGRELFMNNCIACHRGPGDVGGHKSDRTFAILRAFARDMPAYFRDYVKDPAGKNPETQMVAFPHFTDDDLAALLAFVAKE